MLGEIIIAAAAFTAGGVYALGCWRWPYTNCPRCGGEGKRRAWWSRRAWRPCRRCKGSGQRLRRGRRLYNLIHNAGR